jgi:phosphatidylglycerophosphate synthase
MRKIPAEAENPIDNLIYVGVEAVAPLFHDFGWTPNMITTASNVAAAISVYCIYKRKFAVSAALFLLAYFFDCLDGYVARKYNMVTVFGDWYDHISDVLKVVFVFIALLQIDFKLFLMVFLIYLCFIMLACVHLGHQELYYNAKSESGTLHALTFLCDVKDRNNKMEIMDKMQYTRYFGIGTKIMYVVVVLLVCEIYYGK